MKSKHRVVVLIAHGSRLEAANEEVRQLAAQLQETLQRPVLAAFLELAAPDIPTALDEALGKSPREILVLPYFLTQGRHVQEDIPTLLAAKARAYPETSIKLLDYLGKDAAMPELLAKLLSREL